MSNVAGSRMLSTLRDKLNFLQVDLYTGYSFVTFAETKYSSSIGCRLPQYLLQKQLRTLMLRVIKKFLGCVDFDDLPGIHKNDPVGDLPGEAHFVGDHQH